MNRGVIATHSWWLVSVFSLAVGVISLGLGPPLTSSAFAQGSGCSDESPCSEGNVCCNGSCINPETDSCSNCN